jgi:hypothetical protein
MERSLHSTAPKMLNSLSAIKTGLPDMAKIRISMSTIEQKVLYPTAPVQIHVLHYNTGHYI